MIELITIIAGLAAIAANIAGFVFGYYAAVQAVHGTLDAQELIQREKRAQEARRNDER